MKDINDFGYDGEKLKLGGKEYIIKFTIKDMKLLSQKYESLDKAFNILSPKTYNVETFDNLLDFLQIGLKGDDVPGVEELENLIAFPDMKKLYSILANCITGSTPDVSGDIEDPNDEDKKK